MLRRRVLDYLILVLVGAALGALFLSYGRDGIAALAFLFGSGS